MTYQKFLEDKRQRLEPVGFEDYKSNSYLYDFQDDITRWAVNMGRCAIFADCGLGKTLMQLVWADHVNRHTGKPVLIITPLAVSAQTVREGVRFGIEVIKSQDGKASPITVTNYERIHYFNADDFGGCVCDESSILKSYNGEYRKQITKFVRKMKYRLLCTATAAPNDYIELGTSSEALGCMGHIDMMNRFFKSDQNDTNSSGRRKYGEGPKFHLKPHAEEHFWRWVTSWARAVRKPSDLGYDDGNFILPPLLDVYHKITARNNAEGMLFNLPATGLFEQREEARRTLTERCETVAALVNGTGQPAMVWCHLNDEGDMLQRMIPDAIQVKGSNTPEDKESKLTSFAENRERVLITKPKIGAWGLNLQHCNHVVYFPSHSYEQYYQAVRRCWRFGQTRPVTVDVVLTEGQLAIMENLKAKAKKADAMFDALVREMNNSLSITIKTEFAKQEVLPSWL